MPSMLAVTTDPGAWSGRSAKKMAEGEAQTQNNTALTLVVAANYGGHWDMCQAFQKVAEKMATGELVNQQINEELINQYLSTADLPDPDLFIRTGGEQRVSNFMLWRISYSELLFIDKFWPDMDKDDVTGIIGEYAKRNRRIGQLAYTELYFTSTLWPDFDQNSLEDAIKSFKSRQRRFGHTSEQVLNKSVTL